MTPKKKLNISSSLMTQMIKSPPAIWETWVQSLSWKDPLEKGIAAHSSILAWRIQRTEELGRLHTVPGVAESDTTE